MYTITWHAYMRIMERRITPEEMLSAMDGRVYKHHYGTMIRFDPVSRCAFIYDPDTKSIVTVFRLKRKQVKKWCSK